MIAYARWAFYAHGHDKGIRDSRLSGWERIRDRTGKIPPGLDERPELNDVEGALWALYVTIKHGCQSIGYVELDAYQRATGGALSPWECDLMIAIDKTRLAGD